MTDVIVKTEEKINVVLAGSQGPAGNQGAAGAQGTQGISAYQVAVNNGFVGTEPQWLVSLEADATQLMSDHVGATNPHSITKTTIGLGNVDNTSDVNKPVSSATQTSIDSIKVEFASSFSALPITGVSNKVYITTDTFIAYTWSTSLYRPLTVAPILDVLGNVTGLKGSDNVDFMFSGVTFDENGNLVANVSHRIDTLANLLTSWSAGAGEIAIASDVDALVLYTGDPSAATAFYKGSINNTKYSVIMSSSVPVGIAQSGTITANTGAITFSVALPMIYSGGIWMYFPAGAVSGGLEGFYWTVMSSTTSGIVYTGFISAVNMGVPAPYTGTLTPANGSGVAYVGITAAVSFAKVDVPANSMGDNGVLMYDAIWSNNNSANGKIQYLRFGGTSINSGPTVTTSLSTRMNYTIRNRGSKSRQVMFGSWASWNNNSAFCNESAINTVNTQQAEAVGKINTASDYIILESLFVTLIGV